MARSEAELEKRSQEADAIIADLTAKIEQIKAMGKLPPNIQETILKQENAQLRFNFLNFFFWHTLRLHFQKTSRCS